MSARSGMVKRSAAMKRVDASLLDILDHVLTKGVVVRGEVVLGVADVDLIYLGLSAVLCSADRILGPSSRSRNKPRRRGRVP